MFPESSGSQAARQFILRFLVWQLIKPGHAGTRTGSSQITLWESTIYLPRDHGVCWWQAKWSGFEHAILWSQWQWLSPLNYSKLFKTIFWEWKGLQAKVKLRNLQCKKLTFVFSMLSQFSLKNFFFLLLLRLIYTFAARRCETTASSQQYCFPFIVQHVDCLHHNARGASSFWGSCRVCVHTPRWTEKSCRF